MPGMIVSCGGKVGDAVKTGGLICVLEAVKRQNSQPAPGTVKAINLEVFFGRHRLARINKKDLGDEAVTGVIIFPPRPGF
jgi:glycine cleavage system H lipoate-binding protein